MRWIVGLAVLSVACGPSPRTLADACFELGATACGRLNDCDGLGGGTEGDCRSGFTTECCRSIVEAGGSCASSLPNLSRWQRCNSAINAMTCGQLLGGVLPTDACRGWGQP